MCLGCVCNIVYQAYFSDARLSKVVNCYFFWKWEKNSTSYPSKVLAFAYNFWNAIFLAAAGCTSCFESLQKCQKAQELCSWCSALDPSAFDFWKRSRRFRVDPGKVKVVPFEREKNFASHRSSLEHLPEQQQDHGASGFQQHCHAALWSTVMQ